RGDHTLAMASYFNAVAHYELSTSQEGVHNAFVGLAHVSIEEYELDLAKLYLKKAEASMTDKVNPAPYYQVSARWAFERGEFVEAIKKSEARLSHLQDDPVR